MFLDTVRKRRSVRKFLDKPVEREKIMQCLEAARLAPSACNGQPWKFIVVDDVALKSKLCESAFSGMYAMNSFCRTAPVIVVVISEKERFITKVGSAIRNTQYYLIDIGIAGEHFALQATELGFGTCWIGWFNEKAVKKILGVPQQRKIDYLLAVGYDVVARENIPSRKPMSEITSFNKV